LGKLYHVAAVYDGKQLQLFVNGKLDAESDAQSGDLLYPKSAPLVVGRYQDDNEFYPMNGRIAEIEIFDLAAKPQWVAHEFSHRQALASLPQFPGTGKLEMVVDPYLQSVTPDGITVMWQTSLPTESVVRYGETSDCELSVTGQQASIHEVRLSNLKPNTQYFYCIEAGDRSIKTVGADGEDEEVIRLRSDVKTFQTAPDREIPFAFAMISDTQGNPKVSGQLAEMAWGERPSFVLHVGDLVDTGANDDDWYDEFFPGMQPLIGRVCLFPVLGNHEGDARNYYDYMSLPEPEYRYHFRYSNAEFFMVDSNRNVNAGSPQYRWLKEKLAESTAQWKFVCHHHPPYSSDENDYGDLWKTNRSTRGDVRMRELAKLYDQYGVDIVWNGHIHSYERTWPIKAGEPTDARAPIYMVAGGGGGSLETPGPFRNPFQNKVKRGHHYVMVHINGGKLELRSYDLEGRVFDSMDLSKPAVGDH
jgi:3',5'-cyclic AMP phosphodiesterase CpdA